MLAVVPTTGAEYLSPREAESITAVRCVKRNGKVVPFDPDRILTAVRKCFASCGSKLDADDQRRTSEVITRRLVRQTLARKITEVGVEQVQDAVIAQLWGEGLTDEATHYGNYREERRKARLNKPVSEATRQRFEEMKEHFPTDIQAYQFMSKFSRWRETDRRRETWRETVFERVMPWFRRVLVKYGCELADAEWSMLEDSMYHLQAGPAMRVVQMAGPALDRCEMGAYNCLSRDTKFVTESGVRSFEDFEDGDLVTVLSHAGEWRPAVVRKYGTQKLNTVVLRRGSSRTEVKATANHRWLLRDGTVTESLKAGDQILTPPTPFADWDYDTAEPDEKLFWAYGLVFGDGTLVKKNGEYRHSMVRLCGDKAKYLERFSELGFSHSFPPSQDGEPTVYTGRYLKSLPSLEADGLRKTLAFVRGWLDADGTKNTNPSPNRFTSLQVTGEDKIAFARSVLPAVGVYITSEQDVTDRETNYGQRSGTTVRFGISQHFGSSKNASSYSVVEVREGEREEVWCLEVDEDASFVLPTGVVTGNCTAMPIVDLKCFPEMLYILMQGCGVGFSVESEFIDQLPPLKKQRGEPPVTIVVEDHTEGWCDALYEALLLWWDGYDVHLDVSKVRAAGTRLKTKGGRASGPGPLLELFAFIRNLVMARQGKRLRDVDAHRLCCFIGRIVQVGGVRRAATISLSDLDSIGMRDIKSSNWWADTTYWSDGKYLSMANNSAVYEERPSIETFMSEWLSLVKSKSGERGIFNRQAAELHRPARRKGLQRWIVNPCCEILLRLFGMCNLSIAIARANDTPETLKHKVRVATYFGVMQSLCTDFKYVREEWKKNCEEERLLGVDITGHADCPLLRFGAPGRAELLKELKAEVDAVARSLSERFGINYSAANTCVKPSGDSAVFFDCASGVSPRFAAEQIRWVRESKDSPVARYLTDAGVPNAPAPEAPDSLKVFGFPRKSPEGSTTRDQMTALDQLNNWLEWKTCWAEHSVSATIYVDEDEWLEAGAWVYEHFDHVTGLSFLPRDNGTYVYAPNEQLTPEQYAEWEGNFPALDWSKLTRYEDDDQTDVTGAVACANGVCGF